MATTFLWIVSIIFLVAGGYLMAMNWFIFFNNYIMRWKWTSAVPVFGGAAACVGLLLLPIEGAWKFCWVPLLADWGSVPVIVVSLVLMPFHKNKNEKSD